MLQQKAVPSPRSASYSEEDLHRLAAGFEPVLPHNLVSADGDAAVFSPAWNPASPSTEDMAFCIYRLPLADYGELAYEQTVGFEWSTPPHQASDYWIGLGNQQTDSWDWFAGPDDGVVTVECYTPYEAPSGDVLMALVVLDDSACVLDSFTIGEFETRGTGAQFALADNAVVPMPELWREVNPDLYVDLSPDCSPVRDQNQIPSCSAMSVVDGAFNYELGQTYSAYDWDFSDLNHRMSPRWTYVWTGIEQGHSCPDGIRCPYGTIEWLQINGSATEKNAVYGSGYMSTFDCSTEFDAEAYWDAELLKPDGEVHFATKHPVTGNWHLSAQDIEDMKTVLRVMRHPLVFPTPLDEQFSEPDYAAGEVWTFNGNNIGGHSMLIVGYNDLLGETGAFRVRNSWGPYWGDDGYCWISYESLMRGDTGSFTFYIWENFSPQVASKYGNGLIPIFPPPDFRAIDPNPLSIWLRWDAVPGAARYNIYRDSQDIRIGTTSGETTFEDTSVEDGLAHVYWITATGGEGTSPFSAPAIGYLTTE